MTSQRGMIHQVPGRLMKHLSMVLPAPSQEQHRALEAAVEQFKG
jgi:hypothetical protein